METSYTCPYCTKGRKYGFLRLWSETCPNCDGTGIVKSDQLYDAVVEGTANPPPIAEKSEKSVSFSPPASQHQNESEEENNAAVPTAEKKLSSKAVAARTSVSPEGAIRDKLHPVPVHSVAIPGMPKGELDEAMKRNHRIANRRKTATLTTLAEQSGYNVGGISATKAMTKASEAADKTTKPATKAPRSRKKATRS